MKMSRLPSTTQQPTAEAIERATQALFASRRRVEPIEGVVNQRERSPQQELAAFCRAGPPVERRRRGADGGDPDALRQRYDTRSRRPGTINEKA